MCNSQRKSSKKAIILRHKPDAHILNKNESKAFRKIMSNTGLTKIEVVSEIKYRRELAYAQDIGEKPKYSKYNSKRYFQLIKISCKLTGLVPQHPETLKVIQELLDSRNYYPECRLNAQQFVMTYARY